MSLFRAIAIGILFAIASVGFAKPPFLKVLLDAYKIGPNSPLGKAKCLSCHLSPAPPKRNSFGLDVQAAMEKVHARMLTAEILKSVEKRDSDGDGFSNLTEIRAGTLPGDKSSKPAKPGIRKTAFHDEKSHSFLEMGLLPLAFLCLGRRPG